MTKPEKLENSVRALYERKDPNRSDWADWLYRNHVFVVADYAEVLAKQYGSQIDLCRAAAVLHDIADTSMPRLNPGHEEESLKIARNLLADAGFDADEIAIIVDDALRLHSCHDGQKPSTLVGKVLSTADALAHVRTNFYEYATENLMPDKTDHEKKEWAAKKLPRDFYDKIAFEEVRQNNRSYFDILSARFTE